MSILNSWQRIDRVLVGRPFGNGTTDFSSPTVPTLTNKSCSGTADSTTLTAVTTSPFTVNDLVLIHQTRGTGVGQWEVNRIQSVGSGTYTLYKALKYTYTDSGSSQAQVILIPQYKNITVEAGTWTIPAWNTDTGGILVFAARENLTITGSVVGTGGNGTDINSGGEPGNQGGFRGGQCWEDTASEQGEGSAGDRGTASQSANGNGGGGGSAVGYTSGGGGGGGGGVAGSTGNSVKPGAGGSIGSSSDLITLIFGGGGGGGADVSGTEQGSGANGGAIAIIFAKNIVSVNAVTINGGTGGSSGSSYGGGGGGAGGSVLVVCQTATLGTNKISATAGSGQSGGGAGGAGVVAVHHAGAITGTTNPTFTDTSDTSLIETDSGFLMNFI